MPAYSIMAYNPRSFGPSTGTIFINPGDTLWIDPGFDAPSGLVTLTITDDEPTFGGDIGGDELGDDSTKTGRAQSSGNSTIGSGRIHTENEVIFSDGERNLFDLYSVEIGGSLPGVLAVPDLVPGVT